MPSSEATPPSFEVTDLDQELQWELAAQQLAGRVGLLGGATDFEENWATVITSINDIFSNPEELDHFRNWLHTVHEQKIQTGIGSWPTLAKIVGQHADSELARDRRYKDVPERPRLDCVGADDMCNPAEDEAK